MDPHAWDPLYYTLYTAPEVLTLLTPKHIRPKKEKNIERCWALIKASAVPGKSSCRCRIWGLQFRIEFGTPSLGFRFPGLAFGG